MRIATVLAVVTFEVFLVGAGAATPDEARWETIQTHLKADRFEEALAAFREIEKTSTTNADLPAILLKIAVGFCRVNKDREAIPLFQEIIDQWPASSSALKADLEIGKAYYKLGDEEKMVQYYENAASSKPSPADPYGIACSEACRHLGDYYMKKHRWADSVKWWLRWEPNSWCGTCNLSMKADREDKILFCSVQMELESGRPERAIQRLEQVALSPGGGLNENLMVLLVDLCQKNGKLAELEYNLQAARQKPSGLTSYLEMLHQAEKGDYEPLWKQISHLNQHPFIHGVPLVARVLATQGERVKPFLMQKLKDAEADRKEGGDPLWILVLLGAIKAPETQDLVKPRIESEKNVHCLKDYFYALALLGTEKAYAVIRDHADHAADNRQAAAREVLERYPKPGSASLQLP